MNDLDWRALHGGLFLLFVPLPTLLPGLMRWPWHFALPLLGYAAVVVVIPPLRRTFAWLHAGHLGRRVLAVSGGIILIASAALVLFQAVFVPDLAHLRAQFPDVTGGRLVLFGVYFSLLNALLEEVVFRGVVQDALESQFRPITALLLQAIIFGIAHYQGYPMGILGVVLAAIYGLMLGWLRNWAGGLAAPVLVHVFADATIFALVVADSG
jgi:membrane protease YdiL (CAAX protease family)